MRQRQLAAIEGRQVPHRRQPNYTPLGDLGYGLLCLPFWILLLSREAGAGKEKLGQLDLREAVGPAGSKSEVGFRGKTVNQASTVLSKRVDDCLVLEESKKVVSRRDLVMKSWKAQSYSFADVS